MKNLIIISLIALGANLHINAQSYSDIFEPTGVNFVWLGIDYSQVELIGSFDSFKGAGSKNADQIRDVYFPAWNNIVLSEASKYNIAEIVGRTYIENNIEMISELNSKATPKIRVGNQKSVETNIYKIVDKYDFTGMEGIGLVLVARELNKNKAKGYYTFLVINLQTKEIMAASIAGGKATGMGLKNYWAGSFRNAISSLRWEYKDKAFKYNKEKHKIEKAAKKAAKK